MACGNVKPAMEMRHDRSVASRVSMRAITKRYGATLANDSVDLELHPSEIHALLGENGAGKTTLMNILFGLVAADAGEIWLDGVRLELSGPHDALARGIGMVHQHFLLVRRFTVAENVVLGSASLLNAKLNRAENEQAVREVAERFDMSIDVRARIRDLPVDTQQAVEILKLLYRGARIIILDEPTSALGPTQIRRLFTTLRKLCDGGHSIVIVTHKLREVTEIADRVTVLRGGRNLLSTEKGKFDERTLARAMTGREIGQLPSRTKADAARPILLVRDLVVDDVRGQEVVNGIGLEVRAGEILGVGGVEGNGQRELVDALGGIGKIRGGAISVDGVDVTGAEPLTLHRAGVAVVPEDRQRWGLALDLTIAENLALADIPAGRFSRRGFLRPREIREHARRLLAEYDVRPADPRVRVLALSGGNQQKVVLARELSRQPRLLIAANPTAGLDVGAADYVHRRLLTVRESGSAILLVSSDLDELFKLADRIVVLYRGKVLYESATGAVSTEDLALAMAGTVPGSGAPAPDAEVVKIAELEIEGPRLSGHESRIVDPGNDGGNGAPA